MPFDWQNLIAIAFVAAAVVYLAIRGWRQIARKKAGCGTCSTCPANEAAVEKPLVQITSPSKNRTK
jgi:hypothetical protein